MTYHVERDGCCVRTVLGITLIWCWPLAVWWTCPCSSLVLTCQMLGQNPSVCVSNLQNRDRETKRPVISRCFRFLSADFEDVFATSLLRFCRLIRLVRIVKVFRLKAMKDLRLMVKGLVAGIKTLVLAFTLLRPGFGTNVFKPKTVEPNKRAQKEKPVERHPFFGGVSNENLTKLICFLKGSLDITTIPKLP